MIALLLLALAVGPPRIEAADSLYFAGRPAESLAALRVLLVASPRDTALAWRAARAALAVGWLDPNETTSIASYREAQRHARVAVELAPHEPDALFWLAVSLARHAQVEDDVRTCVRLAHEAHDLAVRVLAGAPDHAGAHDLLGQLHYQVMKTPWALRVIGLRLLGARIRFRASWADAESHLARAVALEPAVVLHHLELGRVYARTGRTGLARAQWQAALALPAVQPVDPLFQQEARALLRGLD